MRWLAISLPITLSLCFSFLRPVKATAMSACGGSQSHHHVQALRKGEARGREREGERERERERENPRDGKAAGRRGACVRL